jgi:hypothetical protein
MVEDVKEKSVFPLGEVVAERVLRSMKIGRREAGDR